MSLYLILMKTLNDLSIRVTLCTKCTWDGVYADVIFHLSSLENPRVKNLDRFFPVLAYKNSRRWHLHDLPWAPGATGAVAGIIFDLSSLQNPLTKKSLSIFPDTFQNSCRWHRHGLPWAPGVPGAFADVIFRLSSLENLRIKSLYRFFPILMKTPEDDIDTGYPGHRPHLGPLRMSYSISAASKTP